MTTGLATGTSTSPTVHGFDEFFRNLYHLNAEEDPESWTYPRDQKFKETFGPRGVLKCKATDRDDPTEHPRWGRVGKQTIEDTGALTRKRTKSIDDETTDAAMDFVQRQVKSGKPFFCWMNTTRMHFRTHVRADHRGKPGLTSRTEYADDTITPRRQGTTTVAQTSHSSSRGGGSAGGGGPSPAPE